MEDNKPHDKKQYSDFDLDVMEEEIFLLGSAYDELPFDATPERLKHGRLLIRKFLKYRQAVKMRNSNTK